MSTRVTGRILRETDAALLLETKDGREVWLPFSQVEYIKRGKDFDSLDISDWIAEKKDLEE